MNRWFPNLFEHGKIGQLEIDNRIVKAPTYLAMGAPDGSVTERCLRYYEEIARGGSGLVVVEAAFIEGREFSKVLPCQLGITDSAHIPGLSSLAQVIQDNGAKAALQIVHHGRGKHSGTPQDIAAQAQWEERFFKEGEMPPPEGHTLEDIRQIVTVFGDAAKRVKEAGFDMVEIHGTHGVLLTNFLSPAINKRTDDYGGSLENRMRIVVEIVKDIRNKVGADFPVGIRLSGSDYVSCGILIEDTIEVAKVLEELGVDVIHISGSSSHSHEQGMYLASPMSMPAGLHVWAAEAIKKVIRIPVIASGSIGTPDLAEEILEKGQADFISMARPLFADPHWARKAREGRPEDIVPCIRCNDGCANRSNRNYRAIQCSVNVALGKEGKFAITPAEYPKKVAVVGSGPGGMEAARVCKLRGHDVTVYEKRELGGVLIEASIPEFKSDLRRLISYYRTQMQKLKIKVIKEEATSDTIKGGNFNAVIVAIGASPTKLDIPGADNPIVTNALEVLSGKTQVGQRVHIVGGGIIGVETGLFLAEQGKEIIFTTRQNELMSDIGAIERVVYEGRLAKQKVIIHTGKRLEAVTDTGTVVADKDGGRQDIAADTVVIASGFVPQTGLRDELEKDTGLEVYAVGDCVYPRRIFDAIHEGYLAASKI